MIQSPTFWLTIWCSVAVFWLLPKNLRSGFLAAVSFGYLFSLDWKSVSSLVVWALVFFYFVPRQPKEKGGKWKVRLLVLGILGYLAYFKYIPPLVAAKSHGASHANLFIPLGISYFTFKFIHYALEVSRGNIANRSLADFLCYIFLFPIFTAGPIERFDHFLANQDDRLQTENLVVGSTRIIHGLIKKLVFGGMIIVPLFRQVTDADILLQRLSVLPVYKVWGFLILSYLNVYMDFSAYSDIAIGASRLFGIRILENFHWPIFAPNIGNFWKRWHMTLAGWCQAYVYMPTIGLTRNPYLAVYLTFLAIGLWHSGDLNWICWGLYHGTGVVVYLSWAKYQRKRKWQHLDRLPVVQAASILATFAFVSAGFAVTSTHGHGGLYGTVRILAKLVNIDLPA